MMSLHILLMLSMPCASPDWSPSAMAQVVAERRAAMDRIEFTAESFLAASLANTDPLIESNWEIAELPGFSGYHAHHVAVAHPVVLHHFMTDAPEVGYAPVRYMVGPDGLTSKLGTLTDDGLTVYAQSPRLEHGVHSWSPILALVDVQLRDCPVNGVNLAGLFASGKMNLVSSTSDRAIYSATLTDSPAAYTVEAELDALATPWRVKVTVQWPHAPAWTVEQHTRATTTIRGFRLPTDAIFVTDNPTVGQAMPEMSGRRGVAGVRLTSWGENDALAAESIGFDIIRQSAVVVSYDAQGRPSSQKYDSHGNLVFAPPTEPCAVARGPAAGHTASNSAWSGGLPWVLVGGVLVIAISFVKLRPAQPR